MLRELLQIKIRECLRRLTMSPVIQIADVSFMMEQGHKEIAILTRSMLEILSDLASYIDVPALLVRKDCKE
jgi:hypothetical protein